MTKYSNFQLMLTGRETSIGRYHRSALSTRIMYNSRALYTKLIAGIHTT